MTVLVSVGAGISSVRTWAMQKEDAAERERVKQPQMVFSAHSGSTAVLSGRSAGEEAGREGVETHYEGEGLRSTALKRPVKIGRMRAATPKYKSQSLSHESFTRSGETNRSRQDIEIIAVGKHVVVGTNQDTRFNSHDSHTQ